MSKTILIVAAHPDDELLGAGATAIARAKAGDSVHVLILGQGALSREGSAQSDVHALQDSAKAAASSAGFASVSFATFPDNAFDSVPLLDITKEVEKHLAKLKPDVVYTHHEHDLNVDHRLTFQAVLTASRPCNENAPAELLTFETLSSTEWQSKDHKQFAPTIYVDVAKTLDAKIEALGAYESEMRAYPHSRSNEGVRILAQYRGLESGLEAAEAFQLVRKIEK